MLAASSALGPLTLAEYQALLPGQKAWLELRDWVRRLAGPDLLFDVLSKGSADSFALRSHGLLLAEPASFALAQHLPRADLPFGLVDGFKQESATYYTSGAVNLRHASCFEYP